jgi:hypothetical protein
MIDILERPVRREQDAIGTDFQHSINQGLGTEIARGGEIEIAVEVFGNLLLPLVPRRQLEPGVLS